MSSIVGNFTKPSQTLIAAQKSTSANNQTQSKSQPRLTLAAQKGPALAGGALGSLDVHLVPNVGRVSPTLTPRGAVLATVTLAGRC